MSEAARAALWSARRRRTTRRAFNYTEQIGARAQTAVVVAPKKGTSSARQARQMYRQLPELQVSASFFFSLVFKNLLSIAWCSSHQFTGLFFLRFFIFVHLHPILRKHERKSWFSVARRFIRGVSMRSRTLSATSLSSNTLAKMFVNASPTFARRSEFDVCFDNDHF